MGKQFVHTAEVIIISLYRGVHIGGKLLFQSTNWGEPERAPHRRYICARFYIYYILWYDRHPRAAFGRISVYASTCSTLHLANTFVQQSAVLFSGLQLFVRKRHDFTKMDASKQGSERARGATESANEDQHARARPLM